MLKSAHYCSPRHFLLRQNHVNSTSLTFFRLISKPETPINIGEEVNAELKEVIQLVFDDIRSIDVVRKALDHCQKILEIEAKKKAEAK